MAQNHFIQMKERDNHIILFVNSLNSNTIGLTKKKKTDDKFKICLCTQQQKKARETFCMFAHVFYVKCRQCIENAHGYIGKIAIKATN